jgi:hypothetical protein
MSVSYRSRDGCPAALLPSKGVHLIRRRVGSPAATVVAATRNSGSGMRGGRRPADHGAALPGPDAGGSPRDGAPACAATGRPADRPPPGTRSQSAERWHHPPGAPRRRAGPGFDVVEASARSLTRLQAAVPPARPPTGPRPEPGVLARRLEHQRGRQRQGDQDTSGLHNPARRHVRASRSDMSTSSHPRTIVCERVFIPEVRSGSQPLRTAGTARLGRLRMAGPRTCATKAPAVRTGWPSSP